MLVWADIPGRTIGGTGTARLRERVSVCLAAAFRLIAVCLGCVSLERAAKTSAADVSHAAEQEPPLRSRRCSRWS